MGFFDKLKDAVNDLHGVTKYIDPVGHYSLDLAHQSSTDLVNETSRGIEKAFGDTWLGNLGEHWKNMSQKDKDDFGRWLTNTGLSAAAVYGGISAAGATGSGGAASGAMGAGEMGAGGIGATGGAGAGAGALGAGSYMEAGGGLVSGAADGGLTWSGGAAGAGSAAGNSAAGAGALGGSSWGQYGSQLASGLLQAYQSQKAADAMQEAGAAANATQRYIFDTLNNQQMPYRQTGYNGLAGMNKLMADPSSITSDPGYEFQRLQGMRGIESSAAARGLGLSGAALKAANRFNTDYATTKFNDVFNRYASAAGLGQVANSQGVATGQNYANQVGATQQYMGNAAAANYLNQGNIYGNALNQLGARLGG